MKAYIFLVSTIVLCSCSTFSAEKKISIFSPKGESVKIVVEIADTPYKRSEGLMYRVSLEKGYGMLFIFEEEKPQAFWMKNTRIPLDILYFDSDKKFVSSASMDPCKADPCKGYPANSPAQYALEVPQGFTQKYAIGDGWMLQI